MASSGGNGDHLPPLPEEYPVTLYVNCRELATLQMTRSDMEDWAIGYLFAEGLIRGTPDLDSLVANRELGVIAAETRWDPGPDRLGTPRRAYLTSGCGSGLTFTSMEEAAGLPPVASSVQVDREQLIAFQSRMHRSAVMYSMSGGVHIAALFRVPTAEMIAREDIGRHNAADKAVGAALRAGWDPRELVMLTSGRVSYEMCAKAARFGVGIVASRTAVTDQAVRLARTVGVELVAYLRPHRMRVYTGGTRLLGAHLLPDPG